MLLEESVCYDQCVLWEKPCQPSPCFILYSKAKLGQGSDWDFEITLLCQCTEATFV